MTETISQKTARLRALREKRDGTPIQQVQRQQEQRNMRKCRDAARRDAAAHRLFSEMERLGPEDFCRQYLGIQ